MEIEVRDNELDIDSLTVEDFESKNLYAYLFDMVDLFEQSVATRKVIAKAEELGVKGVLQHWQNYKKSRKGHTTQSSMEYALFDDGQPIDLLSTWTCDSDGAHKASVDGVLWACTHPLLITKRFYNIDSDTEKIELAFKLGKRWRYITENKSTIASANKIINLADYGISVTSDNAKSMVAYLQELETLNYDQIPTIITTSRLGWVNKEDFMPYTEKVEFDGDQSLNRLFRSVHTKGSETKWVDTLRKMAKKHFAVRLALATSVASPLLKLLNAQPFFVHFWSDMSATGKTLIIMAAASIWGDPSLGEYVQSFNATSVAMERTAEILNNCPIVLDELQLAKDFRGNARFDVYKLAQGQGKGRGLKTGGVDRVAQWCNTIITCGESVIVNENDGQGAFARVLECEISEVLFDASEGNAIANTIRENYGWGGEKIVQALKDIGAEELNDRFSELVKLMNADGVIQDKQVILASVLLVASQILSDVLFDDPSTAVTLAELKPLLFTRKQTSIQYRAYEYLVDWIASNKNSFDVDSKEMYGVIEGGRAYIIRTVFNDIMRDNGFNPRSVLSAFAKEGIIETTDEGSKTRTDVRKRIGNLNARCVSLDLERVDDETTNLNDIFPL